MPRQDNLFDPNLAATWRRLLWVMRGSAEMVEALVPVAAGMTKDEISRLLARAGAPSGKGVEPVEQVLGLMGVVPRSRYEALLQEYEELGARVEEAEQNIDRLRRILPDRGQIDEAEELLDSWGGLVRRTLRAQAGFVRSIANAGSAITTGGTSPAASEGAPELPPPAVEIEVPAPAPAEPAAGPRSAAERRGKTASGSRTKAATTTAARSAATPSKRSAGTTKGSTSKRGAAATTPATPGAKAAPATSKASAPRPKASTAKSETSAKASGPSGSGATPPRPAVARPRGSGAAPGGSSGKRSA